MKLSVVDLVQVPVDGDRTSAFNNAVELAQHVEALGYSRYWLAEHHGASNFASAAPEILIPLIAGKTRTIRVGSGGVLLNHYTAYKVAERFMMLNAMFPNRVDLGFGRGGGAITDFALLGRQSDDKSTYDEKINDLLRWIGGEVPPSDPLYELQLNEDEGYPVPWLLGRSPGSAMQAAEKGIAYAMAAFITPDSAEASLKTYADHFRPSPFKCGLQKPYAALSLNIVCAEKSEAAEKLAMTAHALKKAGNRKRLPLPDEAIEICGGLVPTDKSKWPHHIVGTPKEVAEKIGELSAAAPFDEIIIQDMIACHADRLKSYELIGKVLL